MRPSKGLSKKYRGRVRQLRPWNRPGIEALEDRRLLSGPGGTRAIFQGLDTASVAEQGMEQTSFFIVRIDGVAGTGDRQAVAAQGLLVQAGVEGTKVVASLGSAGLFELRTDEETGPEELGRELTRVPGYKYLQAAEGDAATGRITNIEGGSIVVNPLAGLYQTRLDPGALTPPGGVGPLTGTPPTVLGRFDGLNANDNPFTVSPPDTTLAVGPDHVMEAVNLAVRVFAKDGTVLSTQALDSYFAPLGVSGAGDPNVLYDDGARRWYISQISGNANNELLLAVSNDANPLDGFDEVHSIAIAPPGALADFPKIGFNADAVVMEANNFGGDPVVTTIDKSTLLDRNSSTITSYNSTPSPNFRAMVPAQMHGAAPGGGLMYFVQERSYGDGQYAQVVKMTGVLSGSPTYTYYDIAVNPYGTVPAAQQPGGLVNANDTTFLNADWRGGKLVAAHTVGDAGDSDAHANWYLFDAPDSKAATPALVQEGRLDPGDGVSTYYPTVAITAGGSIAMTYMQSSPAEYASMYVTGRTAGEAAGQLRDGALVAAGQDYLDGFGRAGDYSGVAVDPADGGTFWAANEYKATNAFWNTAVAHFSLGLTVAGTTPANGAIVSAPPAQYLVDFSEAYDPSQIDPSGVTVNGVHATGDSIVDADTIAFTFPSNPVTAQGLQTFDVAAGTVVRQSDGNPVLAYAGSFRYDALRMQVTSTSPADGSVATLPLTTIRVNLNEAVAPSSVDDSDLVLSQGTVVGHTLVSPTAIDFSIAGVTHEGTEPLSIAAGALLDAYGNPSLPYSGSFTLDYGTYPLPTPFTPIGPAGSLVYQSSIRGNIAPAGDTDTFTLSVDRGQTITVIVTPSAGLKAQVDLTNNDDDGSQASATSAAAGQDAVIQTFSVPGQLITTSGPKNYSIRVGGAGGTTGSYTVVVLLNAAAESEGHNGPTDDTLATAQSLEGSSLVLSTASPTANRMAVIGQVKGGPMAGDVYVGVRSSSFFGGSVDRFDGAGNLVQTITNPILAGGVISDVELGPNNVIYVALSTNFSGPNVQGELVKFDLQGNLLGTVSLPDDVNYGYLYPFGFDVAADGSVWVPQLNSGNLVHVDGSGTLLASYFTGNNLPLDAAVRADGQVFISQGFSPYILRLDPGTGNITNFAFDPNYNAGLLNFTPSGSLWDGDFYAPTRFDASGNITQSFYNFGTTDPQVDPSQNLWVSNYAYGQIQRFDPSGNFQFGRSTPGGSPIGVAVAGIDSPTPLPTPDVTDYYKFTLSAGQSASVALKVLSGGAVTLELDDSKGTALALGAPAGQIDQSINDFLATAAGTYYLKVTGNGSTYSLVVDRNSDFSTDQGASFATAQDILTTAGASTSYVLGSVNPRDQVVSTSASGWYDQSGSHDPINLNYAVGLAGGTEYRDFFAFDLSGVSGQLVSAQFRAYNPAASDDGYNGYSSSDPTETYSLFDVTTPVSSLVAGGSGLTATFDDLGGGVAYGSQTVSAADDGKLVTVNLDAAALADLASHLGGSFAVGGALTSLAGNPGDQFLFNARFNSRNYPRQLVLGLAGDDYYRVHAQPNQQLAVQVDVPAAGSGQFVNTLAPVVGLYDSGGHLVATGGAGAGGSASLSYKVPNGSDGLFTIKISGAGSSQGEYLLSVKNNQIVLPPFAVDSTDPPNGATLYTPPASITVNFNDQFNLTTLQGSDLKVDGVPAAGVTAVDGNTASFATHSAFLYNGHYYVITSGAETWNTAESEAQSLGGHLVTVGDQSEQNFLKKVFFSGPERNNVYWIGFNDIAQEGNFVWSSGAPVTYTNWGPGEPNNAGGNENGTVINAYSGVNYGAWNDSNTDSKAFGIIELSSLPAGYWLASGGTHTVSIAAGAIKDIQGTPVNAYTATFATDTTPPRVVGTSVAPGALLSAGDQTFTFTFSEPVVAALVDPTDVALVGQYRGTYYTPTALSLSADGKVLTLQFSGLVDDAYTLTLFSNPGSFIDRVGLELDGEPAPGTAVPSGNGIEGGNFFINFAIDAGAQALPTPLVPVAPLGSLVYQTPGAASGTIAFAGDTDAFTISLDAGQTATIVVAALSGTTLRPTVSVYDPSNTLIGSATAAGDGQKALLQSLPVGAAGSYRIVVGSADGPGLYSVRLVLNAAVEAESNGGARNDSLATAQSLDGAFLDLGHGMSQAAILGTSDGGGGYAGTAVPFGFVDITATGTRTLQGTDDGVWYLSPSALGGFSFPFYGGTYNDIYFSTNGLITFTGGYGTFSNGDLSSYPSVPTIAPFWDDLETFSGGGAVYWQVLGSGSDAELVIQWNNVSFYYGSPPTLNFEAVLGADGSIRFNYANLIADSYFGNNGASATVGIKDAGTDHLTLAYNSGPNDYVGSGQSTLIQAQPPTEDYNSVHLTAGETITVSLADLVGSGVTLDLLDGSGNVLESGTPAANLSEVISNFAVPADGTYYVRVGGTVIHGYNLVVSRDAAFDTEPNGTRATAQPLAGNSGAVGAIVNQTVATVGTTFEGLTGSESGYYYPPDTIAAVGPTEVVEMTNVAIRVWDKAGNVLLTESLDTFFAPLGVPSFGDPYVEYDDMAGRWYVLSIDGANNANILLAVSNDSNFLDGFDEMHRILVTPGGLADFPKMGYNADAVVLEANNFGDGYPNLVTIQKSSLLDGNSGTITSYASTPAPNFRAMVPAQMHGAAAGSPMYFIQERSFGDGGAIQVVTMTNYLSASPTFVYTDLPVAPYLFPPSAQQPGGYAATNDTTFTQLDWRDGKMVAAHTVGLASDPSAAKVRWYQIATTGAAPALIQQGNIDPGPGISTYFGSIAQDAAGDLGITYMESSITEPISMYVAGQGVGSAPGSMSPGVVVAPGLGYNYYSEFRNGDYSGIAVDPADGATFWAANEYAGSDFLWNTKLASFQVSLALDGDWYSVDVTDGNVLQLTASVPASGPGEFVNNLVPRVELYDSSGTLIGSAQGIGAVLTSPPLAGGTYSVRLSSVGVVGGEYVLTVAQGPPPSGAAGLRTSIAAPGTATGEGVTAPVYLASTSGTSTPASSPAAPSTGVGGTVTPPTQPKTMASGQNLETFDVALSALAGHSSDVAIPAIDPFTVVTLNSRRRRPPL